MKKYFFLAASLFVSIMSMAQTKVQITADLGTGAGAVTSNVKTGDEITVGTSVSSLNGFALHHATLPAGSKLVIKVAGVNAVGGAAEYGAADIASPKQFTFQSSIINKQITITEHVLATATETPLVTFKFVQAQGGAVAPVKPQAPGSKLEPLSDFLDRMIQSYELTPQGWVLASLDGLSKKEKRRQINTVHLFFDEYGNSLLGAVPQGISNRPYVAHIIYRGYTNAESPVRYSVKQKSGTFNSMLSIHNSGAIKNLPGELQNAIEGVPFDTWKIDQFPLGIATDDLVFDIIATTEDDDGKPVKVVLETQTIKMSPVYHATIDVGLVNSKLANPSYALVAAPDGSADQVVKETDRGSRGVVTAMATFYVSPVVLIEKLFQGKIKKRIPSYKVTGRSFFDDHSLFERFYPTVGVSLGSKSFQNLFFGLNWELARGLSVFGGGHWGKVNTFEMPLHMAGITPVTEAQFALYQNTKWKVDWAYGVKLDIAIVGELFK